MTTDYEFTDIYDEYYQKIISYVIRFVGPNEAEDVTQDVFDKISRNLGKFNEKSKLSTWIYRIATNTAIDTLRSSSYKQTLVNTPLKDISGSDKRDVHFFSKAFTADQAVIRKEMSDCVNEYIDSLPIKYKTVLVLSELKDFSNREIADILGISLENAKIRLHRAKAKLKGSLNDGCDFYHFTTVHFIDRLNYCKQISHLH